MTDISGNPEEERNSDFYNQNWTEEAIHRYFYRQVCKIKFYSLKFRYFYRKVSREVFFPLGNIHFQKSIFRLHVFFFCQTWRLKMRRRICFSCLQPIFHLMRFKANRNFYVPIWREIKFILSHTISGSPYLYCTLPYM